MPHLGGLDLRTRVALLDGNVVQGGPTISHCIMFLLHATSIACLAPRCTQRRWHCTTSDAVLTRLAPPWSLAPASRHHGELCLRSSTFLSDPESSDPGSGGVGSSTLVSRHCAQIRWVPVAGTMLDWQAPPSAPSAAWRPDDLHPVFPRCVQNQQPQPRAVGAVRRLSELPGHVTEWYHSVYRSVLQPARALGQVGGMLAHVAARSSSAPHRCYHRRWPVGLVAATSWGRRGFSCISDVYIFGELWCCNSDFMVLQFPFHDVSATLGQKRFVLALAN
jgi:hypothetical protein